jgi:hypothetical protein
MTRGVRKVVVKSEGSVEPLVGETVKIVKTLLGGDDPTGFGKIRVYPPTVVEVLAKRTKTYRLPSGETKGQRMVQFKDTRTGEVYPEVKMGSLLHAAGLVEEEEQDAGSIIDVIEYRLQLRREVGTPDPSSSPFAALSGLKDQMEREGELRALWLLGHFGEPIVLANDLSYRGKLIAASGQTVTIEGSATVEGMVIVELEGGFRYKAEFDSAVDAIPNLG